ncbi:MAG: amidohydrolase [Acidobacteria bacterium]|nr:amidohydrolase [Acidobacteriota bacterium]
MKKLLVLLALLVFFSNSANAQQALDKMIEQDLPSLVNTYQKLHANPELSHKEEKTSTFIAEELRKLGYEVTERVGKYERTELTGYGIVALLKNGSGPTVLIRADMDALPIEEKTGLPFASKVKAKNDLGEEVFVMHGCGHDIHMTSFLGTAKMLVTLKNQWRGTLMLVGQPAEERGTGAKAMLNDGLYSRFPKPNYVLALHDSANLEAGKVGYTEGYSLANVNSVNITVRGLGGHGAYPHTTKDPVVLAAQIILGLQTIVSRENSPLDPAVVTVGSINGGTKHNIIPDEVKLQLTVRTYKEEVRQRVLSSIERITKGIALAAGVPENRLPIVEVVETEFTPATFNNPELSRRISSAFEKALGKENVVKLDPVMGGEDFGRFNLNDQIPGFIFWLGAVEPSKVAKSRAEATPLPSLHSSQFAPMAEPTIFTGVKAMTLAALELLK